MVEIKREKTEEEILQEAVFELDKMCAEKQPVKAIKAQVEKTLKEVQLPNIQYQNKLFGLLPSLNTHSDVHTTLFIMATQYRANNIASFLLEQKLANKKAIIVNYDTEVVLPLDGRRSDTLAHMAVQFDNMDVFSLLIKNGVSSHKKDGCGLTPEQLAYALADREADFYKEHFMKFAHCDTPRHNSDMYLFAHENHGVETHATTYFKRKACLEMLERFCGEDKEENATPVASKIAYQNVQLPQQGGRERVG